MEKLEVGWQISRKNGVQGWTTNRDRRVCYKSSPLKEDELQHLPYKSKKIHLEFLQKRFVQGRESVITFSISLIEISLIMHLGIYLAWNR